MKLLGSLIILISLGFAFKSKYISDLTRGQQLLVTHEEHIDWPVFSSNSDRIVFATQRDGYQEISLMYLNTFEIDKSYNGLYSAKYLQKGEGRGPFSQQIMTSKDTTFSQLSLSLNNNDLLSVSTINGLSKLLLIDIRAKSGDFLPITDVKYATWLSTTEILWIADGSDKTIQLYNLETDESQVYFESEHPINGISVQKYDVTVTCEEGVYVSKKAPLSWEWSSLPITGQQTWFLNATTIISTLKDGSSSIIDLNNNKMDQIMFASTDKNPIVSFDERYIAFYSETVKGIVITVLNDH